jgi:hypothetical protein
MIPAASVAVLPPTVGEQVRVRFENEPEALFTVVSAEGGGLAVVVASGASAEAYGFDPGEDEWRYPRGEARRDGIPAAHTKATASAAKTPQMFKSSLRMTAPAQGVPRRKGPHGVVKNEERLDANVRSSSDTGTGVGKEPGAKKRKRSSKLGTIVPRTDIQTISSKPKVFTAQELDLPQRHPSQRLAPNPLPEEVQQEKQAQCARSREGGRAVVAKASVGRAEPSPFADEVARAEEKRQLREAIAAPKAEAEVARRKAQSQGRAQRGVVKHEERPQRHPSQRQLAPNHPHCAAVAQPAHLKEAGSEPPHPADLAARCKTLIQSLGMTQADAAREIGTSGPQLSRWMSGKPENLGRFWFFPQKTVEGLAAAWVRREEKPQGGAARAVRSLAQEWGDGRGGQPMRMLDRPSPEGPPTCVAEPDEMLSGIAERLGVDVMQLIRANKPIYRGLRADSTLWGGTKLLLGTHAPPAKPPKVSDAQLLCKKGSLPLGFSLPSIQTITISAAGRPSRRRGGTARSRSKGRRRLGGARRRGARPRREAAPPPPGCSRRTPTRGRSA